MKRFTRTGSEERRTRAAVVVTVIFFFAVLGLFLYGMEQVDSGAAQNQETVLEQAVNRDITLCYAREGRYPESVKYMEDHYGLTYDKSAFSVKYQLRGSNIRPYVTVIRKESSGDLKGLGA